MSPEELKTLAARFITEVINPGNFDRASDYLTADFFDHALPPGLPNGLEGLKAALTMFKAAMPDLRWTVEDAFVEGDKVVQRGFASGTLTGSFMGMPPTGKRATWSETHITRWVGGKLAEHWAAIDQLGMMQQVGLAPTPGQ